MRKKDKVKKPLYKRPWFIILIVFIIIGVISGGSEDNKKSEKKEVASKDNKIIELKFDVNEEVSDNKVKVSIDTNLPDGTELMVSLDNDDVEYSASDKVTVSDGKAESDWFSNKGNELVNATYKLSVTLPISSVQPENVQKIVGKDYENVKSNLIKKGDLGVSLNVTKNIDISDSDVNTEDVQQGYSEDKKNIEDLYNELYSEYVKQKENYDEIEWGKFSRDWNQKRKEKEKEIGDDSKMEYKIAIKDLFQLWQEMKNDLAGKKADVEYFDNSIKEALQD